jgi:hypothetical protein
MLRADFFSAYQASMRSPRAAAARSMATRCIARSCDLELTRRYAAAGIVMGALMQLKLVAHAGRDNRMRVV